MEQENIVLCGANSYEEKYFFNEQFAALPTAIKDELKIMCVLFVNQVGGILLLERWYSGYPVMRTISSSMRSEAACRSRNCGGTRKSFWLLWNCFTVYSF